MTRVTPPLLIKEGRHDGGGVVFFLLIKEGWHRGDQVAGMTLFYPS
jgi:hypothetical protein